MNSLISDVGCIKYKYLIMVQVCDPERKDSSKVSPNITKHFYLETFSRPQGKKEGF